MKKAKDITKTHTMPVLVCTDKRGVFFGYADPKDVEKIMKAGKPSWNLALRSRRMVLYWTESVKGVFGLAATGPEKGCNIGPAVPGLCLCVGGHDLASVSAEAVQKWEAGPWGG